ncbi:MAG: tRNA uridine-5-carboxymethylaminomethyl(34) synthesis GTPase MnmE [Bacteroides sp.]|nr:tRNA uridine-5-carboxymethylaminomethyl(34) synthesis GTPase MnmE [Bacteroides sp.]
MEQFEVTSADTIAAISTPPGTGGIAVVRVSGPEAISIVNNAWKGKSLHSVGSHTVHLGSYLDTSGQILDECVATVFRSPRTFTGEDVVELSIHGSKWIQREILADLIRRGARVAQPGEFTQRAFLNGRLDLAQAEGVADLIAASSKAAHTLAVSQTRGNFSKEIDILRDRLIEFASLLELELDFSEEEVEFADRQKLLALSTGIINKIDRLSSSYSSGAVLKEGVPVVIAGIPNAGKSSLLNLLLNDDKAIVSDIPGTTRDSIEDTVEINGILYRFIDTAGLRDSNDTVEKIGIDRARLLMKRASIVIWLIDPTSPLPPQQEEIITFLTDNPESRLILLQNKSDLPTSRLPYLSQLLSSSLSVSNPPLTFSTKTAEGLPELIERLTALSTSDYNPENELIITNIRHYEALKKGSESLQRAIRGIEDGISGDFIAQDVREALHHLGTITGAITTHTLLTSIFSRFCIGK